MGPISAPHHPVVAANNISVKSIHISVESIHISVEGISTRRTPHAVVAATISCRHHEVVNYQRLSSLVHRAG